MTMLGKTQHFGLLIFFLSQKASLETVDRHFESKGGEKSIHYVTDVLMFSHTRLNVFILNWGPLIVLLLSRPIVCDADLRK